MIILAYASLLCFGLLDNLRGPEFSEILADLHLSHTQGSLFFAFTSGACFLATLFIPRWVARWGSGHAMVVGLIFLGGMYFLESFSQSLLGLLAGAAFFGVGVGLVSVTQNILILEAAPVIRHRQLLSGLHSMYALSALTAPLIAQWFSHEGFSWRGAFRAVSVLPLLLAVWAWRTMPARSSVKGMSAPPPIFGMSGRQWLVVLTIASYQIAEIALSTRLTIYLEQSAHWSLAEARNGLFVFFVLLFAGRLLMALRTGSATGRILLFSAGSSLVSFALGLFVSPYFLLLCGFLMAPFFPLVIEWIGQLFHGHHERMISQGIAWGALGIVTMHFTVGVLADHFSLQTALLIGPAALLVTVISVLALMAPQTA